MMDIFTAAVGAESLFGRTTTGICLWSVSDTKLCFCVSTLQCTDTSGILCASGRDLVYVCIRGKFVKRPATPPPTGFYSIQFHQR